MRMVRVYKVLYNVLSSPIFLIRLLDDIATKKRDEKPTYTSFGINVVEYDKKIFLRRRKGVCTQPSTMKIYQTIIWNKKR